MKNKVIILVIVIIMIAIAICFDIGADNYTESYTIEELINIKFEDIKKVKYEEVSDIDIEKFIEEYKNAKFIETNDNKKYESKYKDTQESFEINHYSCYDKEDKLLFTISYTVYEGNKLYQIYNKNDNVYVNADKFYKKIN